MDVLKIILGAIATVLVFYATSSMLLAQKQLFAATRLSGYLHYWQRWILEHGLSKIYALGLVWNQEVQEIRKHGGDVTDVAKLEEEKKKQIETMKQLLETGIGLDKDELTRYIQRGNQRYSKESILESTRVTTQNLIDGKTFISDEEAAALGAVFAHKCIELKMGILDLVNGGTGLAISLLNQPDFDLKDYSDEVAEMIWKGIFVSRNIDLISRAARAVSSKSVAALTLQNMLSGKQLTKR